MDYLIKVSPHTYWSHEVHNTYYFCHYVFQFTIRTISNSWTAIILHEWLYEFYYNVSIYLTWWLWRIYFQMVGILCCIWCVAYIFFTCVCVCRYVHIVDVVGWLFHNSSTPKLQKFEDVAQKTNNPDAKVMADTLSTAVGLGSFIKGKDLKGSSRWDTTIQLWMGWFLFGPL